MWPRGTPRWPALGFALLLSGAALPSSSAQEAAPSQDAANPAEAYQAVLDSIAAQDSAIVALDRTFPNAQGDDGRLIQRRRVARLRARHVLVLRLAELVQSLPADALQAERAATADSLLSAELATTRERAIEAVADAARLRSEASSLEGAARAGAEQRIRSRDAEISELYRAYHETLTRMEARGADTSEGAAELDRALRLRAEVLAARMEIAEEDIAALRERIDRGIADADVTASALEIRVEGTAESLESALDLMEERGLETAEYRRYLLVNTGLLSAEDLDVDVLRELLEGWASQTLEWVRGNGAGFLFRGVLLVFLVLLFWMAARVVRRVLTRALATSGLQMTNLLRDTLVRWTTRLVLLLGILLALSQMGVELGPLLAGLGVAGFIVGFALQDTLSNFAAGVMILLYRPFDVDDVVEAGGVLGKITDLSLVSTTVHSLDNQRYIVPNSKIWGDVIKNVTAQDVRRVDLTFGISYADDVERAEAVLERIVRDHPLVLEDPTPVIKLHRLGDSSVDFVVRPWCKTADYWDVYWDVTRSVKLRFDQEGITIPFPQRDVHLLHEAPSDAAAPGPA